MSWPALQSYMLAHPDRSADVLVRRDSHLELPGFWALHMNAALRDHRLVRGVLAEPSQIESAYQRIVRTEQWPYVPVAWRTGRFFVVYRGDRAEMTASSGPPVSSSCPRSFVACLVVTTL